MASGLRGACQGRQRGRWSWMVAGWLAAVVWAALAWAAAMPGPASALSGKPIEIGSPQEVSNVSVGVDASGTVYVAYGDQEVSPNTIPYCVIAHGSDSCKYYGTLTPADSASNVDDVQVLVDGSTVVILASVYGASSEAYEPVQEWQSTNGGESFSSIDSGKSVSQATINGDTGPLNAVIVPGTGELGFGFETPEDPPTFNAFPLDSPPTCSDSSCSAGFAELQPTSGVDEASTGGGAFAAQGGSSPGVLGVFDTLYTEGNLGCGGAADGFGTAFAYGSGDQSATNSYDKSAGDTDSAWNVAVSKLDCDVDYATVAGGPSGFGVLEQDDKTGGTIYHRFDQAHEDFDTKPVTVVNQEDTQPALSQDGTGGIYATYLYGGSGGPVELSYSPNAGANWTSAAIHQEADGNVGSLTSAVGSSGQGWAAWLDNDNGSIYAQQFDARDAYVDADVEASAPSSVTTRSRTKIKIPVTCPIACKVTLTLTKGSTKLGSAHLSLSGAGKHTVTVTLTHAGASLLRDHDGKLKATISLKTVDVYGTFTSSHSLKIR